MTVSDENWYDLVSTRFDELGDNKIKAKIENYFGIANINSVPNAFLT